MDGKLHCLWEVIYNQTTLQTWEPSSFYGHLNVTHVPLLPKCQVTKMSKELQEFHFYVRKCHILVRKVPILLTHLKERDRENKGKRELVPSPVKIMKGWFVLEKKKERKLGLNLLPLTNHTLTRCSYYVLRCMGGSNLTRTKGKRGKNPGSRLAKWP